jgi:hypothetical protein
MSKIKQLIVRKEVLSLLITTLVILTLLFASSPTVRAVSINFTSLPASGTLGSTYSFTVKVDVQNTDLLPIKRVNLEIYNVASPSTYRATCANLPAVTGIKSYTSAKTGGGAVSVSASTAANWGGASGVTRYGYGYGYQLGWGTYSFGTGYGYGYGYGSYVGSTSITYSVTWTPPATWPAGTYKILILVYGNGGGKAFTTSVRPSFTLSAPVTYAAGGGGGPAVRPGVTKLRGFITSQGVFTERVTAESEDGNVGIVINKGTIGLTKEGRRLSEISITEIEDSPAPPADAGIVGLVYDIGPDGATFDPSVTLTFTYATDEVPDGIAEEDLVLALWDEEAGEWVELVCVVDPDTNTITAEISHFTAFTIIALAPPVLPEPAAFSLSGLSVEPGEVQPKEAVAITVSVANTGGTEGAYTVVLKINGVKETERSVTVAAGSSKMVNFSVSRKDTGSYSITVDGLSASFTVVAPPVEKPSVEKPPVEEVPAKPGVNWGLIGSIIVAVLVLGLLVYFLWWRRRIA